MYRWDSPEGTRGIIVSRRFLWERSVFKRAAGKAYQHSENHPSETMSADQTAMTQSEPAQAEAACAAQTGRSRLPCPPETLACRRVLTGQRQARPRTAEHRHALVRKCRLSCLQGRNVRHPGPDGLRRDASYSTLSRNACCSPGTGRRVLCGGCEIRVCVSADRGEGATYAFRLCES